MTLEDLQLTLQILKWLFGSFGLVMISVQGYNALQLNRLNDWMRKLDLSNVGQGKDIESLKNEIGRQNKSKDRLAHDIMVRHMEIDSRLRALEEKMKQCKHCNGQ